MKGQLIVTVEYRTEENFSRFLCVKVDMASAKTARNAADIVASEVPALVHEALEDAEGER